MKKALKKVSFWLLSLFSGLYTAFVAMCFWNWFVSPAFSLSSYGISYWNMVGLIMFVDLIWSRNFESRDMVSEMRWKVACSIGEICLPEEKKEAIKEVVDSHLEPQYSELFFKIFGNVVGNTFILILGGIVCGLS